LANELSLYPDCTMHWHCTKHSRCTPFTLHSIHVALHSRCTIHSSPCWRHASERRGIERRGIASTLSGILASCHACEPPKNSAKLNETKVKYTECHSNSCTQLHEMRRRRYALQDTARVRGLCTARHGKSSWLVHCKIPPLRHTLLDTPS
jgi:hypothetical protein